MLHHFNNQQSKTAYVAFEDPGDEWANIGTNDSFTIILPITYVDNSNSTNSSLKTVATGTDSAGPTDTWAFGIYNQSGGAFRLRFDSPSGARLFYPDATNLTTPAPLLDVPACLAMVYDATANTLDFYLTVATEDAVDGTSQWSMSTLSESDGSVFATDRIHIGGRDNVGSYPTSAARQPAIGWAVACPVLRSGAMSAAAIQTMMDRKDPGAFYLDTDGQGRADILNQIGDDMSGTAWFPGAAGSLPAFSEYSSYDATGHATAMTGEVGLDASSNARLLNPLDHGWEIDPTLVGNSLNLADNARPNVKFENTWFKNLVDGAPSSGILFTSANSRGNSGASYYPDHLDVAGVSGGEYNTVGLDYADDYASNGEDDFNRSFGNGYVSAHPDRFIGYAVESIYGGNQPPFPNPPLAHAFTAWDNNGANMRQIRAGTLLSGDNLYLRDWTRLFYLGGGNSDLSEGIGLSNGIAIMPTDNCYFPVSNLCGRDPGDELTVLAILIEHPNAPDDVDVEAGYVNSAGTWVDASAVDSETGIDLDTTVESGTVNGTYVDGGTTIRLQGSGIGGHSSGDMIVIEPATSTSYRMCGVLAENWPALALSGNFDIEHQIGDGTRIPSNGDNMWVGPWDYRVVAITIPASAFGTGEGEVNNNWPGIRITNNHASRPLHVAGIIPISNGLATVVALGQGGSGYGRWTGTGSSSHGMFYNADSNGKRPLTKLFEAIGPTYAKAWLMHGATQSGGGTAFNDVANMAPSWLGVCAVADAAISNSEFDDTNLDTYWTGVYDTIDIPFIGDLLHKGGHPMSRMLCFEQADASHHTTLGHQRMANVLWTAFENTDNVDISVSTGGASITKNGPGFSDGMGAQAGYGL